MSGSAQLLEEDRREDIRVIERFIAHQQEIGFVSSRLDSRVIAIACDAIINGLLIDIMAGMDREEAKKVWITTVEALIRVE